ncbi:TonB-dependent receptor [Pedobacter polaris]|uniref:TonB-dependent receptor n=1 Tax=Pedobacter polaris TaxID=2571273 RepID=A0A4U1CK28_9SPHI|nr:TonB-dependent receptor [Pedobacter polaris]TKC05713.1 TonB-dependent receptor [Pedobacter polaris]
MKIKPLLLLGGVVVLSFNNGYAFTTKSTTENLNVISVLNEKLTEDNIVQLTRITGTVKDKAGLPIPGVSISVKNTKVGVLTDNNGKYIIDAEVGSILVFSFTGFKSQEIRIENDTSIDVNLEEMSTELGTVLVVGYSTKKQSEISGSVSVVTGEKLRDVTSNELSSLLQGKAPGVVVSTASGSPTSGSNIIIRGAGSINASTDPLIVVDGNIGGNYNPTDVETITILKDAAATGLYGSRAANGVIIVTTKTGKAGVTKVDFNSSMGYSEASTGNFKLMNTAQLYDYQSKFYTGLTPERLNNDTDWWNLAFRTGMVNSHTASASGGSENTKFYVSGNYYKEEGTLINNDKTGYNFRTNISQKLSEKFNLSVLLNGIFTKDNYNASGALYDAYVNLPFDPAFNGDLTPVDSRYGTWYGRDRDNFMHTLQYNTSKAKSLNVSADINLDYKIIKNLTFSTYNRGKLVNYRSDSFSDKRSKDGATNNGSASASTSYTNTFLTSNRLRYSNTFGKHNLAVLAVGEIEYGYAESLGANVKNLPAGRDAFSTATDIVTNPTSGNDTYQFSKYLGQADYNYDNRYFAVASYVTEYSSRFGSNNPSGNFYQLGASWIISNEAFFKNVKPVTSLKLRASYGTTGNAYGIGYYAALGLYSISSGASYAGLPGAAPSQKANPDLTWEKSKAANIGLDITLFKRIELSIDAYHKQAASLLFFRPLPATTGYNGVYENVGNVRNRGVEFNLTTKNFVKAFKWETNFNMAFNRNKVLEVNQGRNEVSNGARQPIAVGHDMDEWFMPVWSGVNPDNGAPLWENRVKDADGKEFLSYTSNYNAASRVYTGKSSAPKFTGGLSNNFEYKNFSLSTFFNFVYGNYVYNESRFLFDSDGLYESYNQMQLASGWNRWEKPGDLVTHPKPVHGRADNANALSTRFLEDGSYIRLRNVTLGYNLPTSWLTKAKINKARIFISGDNIWTLTKFSGTDPEVELRTGESYIKYPISRKLLFGLNVSL